MSYSDITFKDKNLIKRWLQGQRLLSALRLSKQEAIQPKIICDFGAGNGELCKLLAEHYRNARLLCYEPTASLLEEARQNLNLFPGIEYFQNLHDVPAGTIDVVFCLEVFEHLPPSETEDALKLISKVLKPDGILVVGVPVEVGFPALYKGVFRMLRRYGQFDANIRNVILSSLYIPPANRPMREITPGFNFHFEHMEFDFRQFKKTLARNFILKRTSASPLAVLGHWTMPEVYFVVTNS